MTDAELRDIHSNVLATIYSVSNWSVTEDSTPLDAADSSGGTGSHSIEFDAAYVPQDEVTGPFEADGRRKALTPKRLKAWRSRRLRISELTQGITLGNVTSVSWGSPHAIVADNQLGRLSVNRAAKPVLSTLGKALEYYFGLGGLTNPLQWSIPPDYYTIPVVLVGWYGNVWTQLKKLCVTFGIEIALVSDTVIVRDVRQRISQNYRDASRTFDIDDSQMAASVEVTWYEPLTIIAGDYAASYNGSGVFSSIDPANGGE